MNREQAKDVKWLLADFEIQLGREIDREKEMHTMDENKLRETLREAYRELREAEAGKGQAESEVRRLGVEATRKAQDHAAKLGAMTRERDHLMVKSKDLDMRLGDLLTERTGLVKDKAEGNMARAMQAQKVERLEDRVRELEAEVAERTAGEEEEGRAKRALEAQVKEYEARQHDLVGQLSATEDENRALKEYRDEEAPRLRAENAGLNLVKAERDSWEDKYNKEVDVSNKLKLQISEMDHAMYNLKQEVARLKMEVFKKRGAAGTKPAMA